jgi:hypothetical protein
MGVDGGLYHVAAEGVSCCGAWGLPAFGLVASCLAPLDAGGSLLDAGWKVVMQVTSWVTRSEAAVVLCRGHHF